MGADASELDVRQMIGRLLLIFGYLLFGALATTAIAWASAAWTEFDLLYVEPSDEWIDIATADPSCRPTDIESHRSTTLGATLQADWAAARGDTDAATFVWEGHQLHAGWPFRALSWSYTQFYSTLKLLPLSSYSAGIRLPHDNSAFAPSLERRLPVRPLPVGFLADSLLWAMLAFGGVSTITACRRAWRRRRNRCAECGYLLGRWGDCPECGSPQPSRISTV